MKKQYFEIFGKSFYALPLVLLFTLEAQSVVAAEVKVASGGSIRTELGYGITINKESSLTREWVTINDSIMPASFDVPTGITTVYESGQRYSSGEYLYSAAFALTPTEDLTAVEVRFLTFDIWGNHVRNLSSTEVADMEAGKSVSLAARWKVFSENEVSKHYASIAYIAQARTKSGQVIKADPQAVLAQARKFSSKFTADDLDTKEKDD